MVNLEDSRNLTESTPGTLISILLAHNFNLPLTSLSVNPEGASIWASSLISTVKIRAFVSTKLALARRLFIDKRSALGAGFGAFNCLEAIPRPFRHSGDYFLSLLSGNRKSVLSVAGSGAVLGRPSVPSNLYFEWFSAPLAHDNVADSFSRWNPTSHMCQYIGNRYAVEN